MLFIVKFVLGLLIVFFVLLGMMCMLFSMFVLYNLVGLVVWVMFWLMLGCVVYDSID